MHFALIRHSIQNRGSDIALFAYADYLIQKGHQVSYYTNKIATSLSYNSKIQIKRIPYAGKSGTILFILIHKFLEDMVAFDLIGLSCLGWIRNSKKIVYLARGYDVSYYSSVIMQTIIKFCYRIGLNLFKIPTITASENLTHTLKQYHPSRIFTVTNGIDLQIFNPQRNSNAFLKDPAKKIILLYARREYVKGLDVATKAIQKLLEINKTPWSLWIIGEEFNDISGAHIINFGFLEKEKLRDILCTADIFLLPSRSEGLSPLLLQAIACGCAVVGTEAANIITHEKEGLISPVEDWQSLAKNLNRLLNNTDLESTLKTNALILAQNYSLERSCHQFEETLTEIKNART